jgi:hypothetical protein
MNRDLGEENKGKVIFFKLQAFRTSWRLWIFGCSLNLREMQAEAVQEFPVGKLLGIDQWFRLTHGRIKS